MARPGDSTVSDGSETVLDLLSRAYCDEWVAFSTHWINAKLVLGPMSDAVAAELLQHAQEELRAADALAERILELGEVPVTDPGAWRAMSRCPAPPEDCFVVPVLQHAIETERCVIDTCRRLIREARGTDPDTYELALEVLEQEVEHEEALQAMSRRVQTILEDRW
jgi:bacterioferritin